MTKEEIMKLAREAGPLISTPFDLWCERFANLVAAHKAETALAEAYRCGYEAGMEAGAVICENVDKSTHPADLAVAIRAALEQPEPEKVAWRFWVGDWQYVCDERMLHHLDKDVFLSRFTQCHQSNEKKIDLSPMQEAAQMLRDRAAKQRKDNGND